MNERLESFFEQMSEHNPFAQNRVDRPDANEVDVATIQDGAFQQLLRLAEQARHNNRGIGAVLWGEAGLGKSHLLARLWRNSPWFVYLNNLQASPRQLPRYILKCVLSVLTQGRARNFQTTPLFELVRGVLLPALPEKRELVYSEKQVEWAFKTQIGRALQEDPSRAPFIDHDILAVFCRFLVASGKAAGKDRVEADHDAARLALRWLSGDHLDPEEANLLEMRLDGTADEPISLEDHQIKLVLVILAWFASLHGQTLILCFDQAMDTRDEEQVRALSLFIHQLLDSAGSLLVVTTGVTETMTKLKKTFIMEASWDRMAQHKVILRNLHKPEGRAILAARLTSYFEPWMDVPEIGEQRRLDDLFPLGKAWFDKRVTALEFRPRQVINWAHERWEQQQSRLVNQAAGDWLKVWSADVGLPQEVDADALIDEKVARTVAEQKSRRKLAPQSLPPSAENLAGLVYVLLGQCSGRQSPPIEVRHFPAPRNGPLPTYDLKIKHPHAPDEIGVRTGILFLVNASAQSSTIWLRRLTEDVTPPERVLLVTEERLQLNLGQQKNSKGKEFFGKLRDRGEAAFQHVQLTFEQYADLDALHSAVRQAAEGDLEIELSDGTTRPLTEQDVIDSHHRQNRYTSHRLLEAILRSDIKSSNQEPLPTQIRKVTSGEPLPLSLSNGKLDLKRLVQECEADIRAFIMSQLSLRMGATCQDLVAGCLLFIHKERKITVDEPTCLEGLRTVARKMEDKVNVSKMNNGDLSLMRR